MDKTEIVGGKGRTSKCIRHWLFTDGILVLRKAVSIHHNFFVVTGSLISINTASVTIVTIIHMLPHHVPNTMLNVSVHIIPWSWNQTFEVYIGILSLLRRIVNYVVCPESSLLSGRELVNPCQFDSRAHTFPTAICSSLPTNWPKFRNWQNE